MNFLNSISNFNKLISIIPSWKQLGLDIDGKYSGDKAGYSISLNSIGDKVAIGSPDSLSRSYRGYVSVYSWNGSTWNQLGSDILGKNGNTNSGRTVSLNGAGNIVAIGAPNAPGDAVNPTTFRGQVRVFSWDGSTWTQLGADFDGENDFDYFGKCVQLNKAGNILAISTPNKDNGSDYDVGYVKVYSWNGSTWNQLGSNILGTAAGDYSGFSIDMNESGNRIAIGSPFADGGPGTSSGCVRIFSWNGSSWIQLGLDINASVWYTESGRAVSINAAGDIVAIGSPLYGSYDQGQVKVYFWNGSAWNQLGSTIEGPEVYEEFGFSVSLNAAGDKLAISTPYKNISGFDRGYVLTYSWNGSNWIKFGANIIGEASSDLSGYSISFNEIGDTLAIGAIENDASTGNSDDNRGHVRVYKLT